MFLQVRVWYLYTAYAVDATYKKFVNFFNKVFIIIFNQCSTFYPY